MNLDTVLKAVAPMAIQEAMTEQPKAMQLANYLELAFDQTGAKQAAAELRRLHALNAEWEKKAATWFASPDAVKRLDEYRKLAQLLNVSEQQRIELLTAFNELAAWGDGDVGHHMDEPHAASVARRLLAKYGSVVHIAPDDTEGGHHD